MNADEMSVYKKCTDVGEMSRRLGDINFHTHTELMPKTDIFLCTNYYVFKKYRMYLEVSVLESSKRRSLVHRWKDYTERPEQTGLVYKTFMKDDGDRGVLRTQRHVTDFWNSTHDNLHIPWPVVCR